MEGKKRAVGEAAKEQLGHVLSLGKTAAITCLVTFFITDFIIANVVVPTSSMERTISPGNRVIGTRILLSLERGDIVIFNDPDGSGKYLIKRIIGMPGDHLQIRKDAGGTGGIYINGMKLDEPYLPEEMIIYPQFADLDIRIPEDSYFCLGDNRNHSYDARHWENKFVKDEEIIAQALFRYWPPNQISLIGQPLYGQDTLAD